ncbi:MAG: phosphoribosylformylglycinamidine synthase subunit PurL [Cytophagaceae bacterium]|nr:phosphoribosylformylglycinamidine synthase subunit PurL [Cytophagaceae bacterium]MDW8457364.1 phosphoribosylformylglycinamidine synthase subunit PurL [Cytophagaceae bacterium]
MTKELPTLETAQKLGLLEIEYERIKQILGRTPNFTELSIFSAMWSEHCSYKNSIIWLKILPKDSPRMLAKAGEENAGLVDIGDGLACSFKIESHNHPSAIEPYQGAATGVGGINRDIFTMGARPIAQLNSLRFGNINLEKTKWLLKGVVKGIGDYGNAFGVPTVGGELYFDDCYNVNPLVNAFSAGIVQTDKIARAISYGAGNPVFIVGSATGKDGIHGAAFASKDISEDSVNDLPSVQVGDPFMEKLLLEATLEIIATGHVIGIQDMGAAGLICSTSEMSAKGNHGMDIWLDKVPTRQANMKPWEILLSESQERMLVVVKKGQEKTIQDIFDKWDLHCAQIGVVTESKNLRFFMNGELVAEVPAYDLVLGGGAPQYHREYKEPEYFRKYKKFNINDVKQTNNYKDVARYLLSHPNIASRRWVYEQYDSMVGTANMTTNAPSDAAVVHIKGTKKALVMCVDCNSRYVHANPEEGTAIAVAEAARNVVCSGGIPVAITNNLNFGNPYVPEVYWQFVGAIKGMKKACEKFATPVTGGNVSFYNQSADGGPVFPTPTIGMLGIMEDVSNHMTLNFKKAGDLIFLIGYSKDDISSSEYLYSYLGIKESPPPHFDLNEEYNVQELIKILIKEKLINCAHDVSDGGLFIALAESAIAGNLGFKVTSDFRFRKDAWLFGEKQSRVIVTVDPDKEKEFMSCLKSSRNLLTRDENLGVEIIGTVTNQDLVIDNELFFTTWEASDIYNNALAKLLE